MFSHAAAPITLDEFIKLHIVPRCDIAHARILIVGDVMLYTMLATAYEPATPHAQGRQTSGGAAALAARLCAWGATITLLGIIGHDIAGGWLRTALTTAGVDDGHLIEDAYSATLHTLFEPNVDVAQNGCSYRARFDEEWACHYSGRTQRQLQDACVAGFEQCDLVIVVDLGFGAISDDLMHRLEFLRLADRPPIVLITAPRPAPRLAAATGSPSPYLG